VKIAEKKKKKEQKQGEESTEEQQDDVVQNTHAKASDAVEEPEKPKDKKKKKKKKKLKKINSASTGTVPEVSTQEPPFKGSQSANNDQPQNPPQEKISGHNNESSNSCLQPPSIKVF
jgi:hypothetical protein